MPLNEGARYDMEEEQNFFTATPPDDTYCVFINVTKEELNGAAKSEET